LTGDNSADSRVGTSRDDEPSLRRRLTAARTRAFVGRTQDLGRFGAALAGGENAPSVIYVHGPGGIGKSSLLREWAQEAQRAGRAIVQLDGRTVGRSPAEFEDAARLAMVLEGAVLFVDSFEHCQRLETWLRDIFLPRAAEGSVVVIGGRQPPAADWTVDPGWRAVVDVVELGELTQGEAVDLLGQHGVRPERRAAVLRFAGGNPLALSLAAAVDSIRPDAAERWSPSADFLPILLAGLVGEVPSAAHRRALEVVAQAHTTTEELLEAVLPGEDVYPLFSWLRAQPFMEAIPQGLYPHDAARETLAADLRWRSPGAFAAMRQRLVDEYLRRVREGSDRDAMELLGHVLFLFRELRSYFDTHGQGAEVYDDPLAPEDVDTVLAMAAEAEGAASAELVRYWIGRQPERFSVVRLLNTGRTVAFIARLVLPAPPREEDIAVDPVVAAAWEYCNRTAPVRPGEHIVMTRFSVYPEAYHLPSPVLSLNLHRGLSESYRVQGSGRAQGILVFRDGLGWERRFDGTMALADVRPKVGEHTYALFVNDWRLLPFEKWLAHAIATVPVQRAAAEADDLPARDRFDEAVHAALQNLRNPRELASSDLLRARVAAAAGEPSAETLRALLKQVIDEVGREPRGTQPHDALVAAYLSGAPTQEAAARRLGVPFGSFRRHLRRGVDRVSDLLWERELRGVDGATARGIS